MKRIGDILTRNKTAVVVEDGVSYKQVTIRTNYKGVVLRGTQDGSTILTKNQFVVSAGQFILSRIDARNGAFGIIPDELEGAIVTNDFLAFDINEDEVEREFFNVFLQSPVFLETCIKASRGNTNRKRVDEDFFLNYEVNLPPLSDQHDLIKQINEGRSKLALAQHEITHQQSLLAKLKQAILQEAIQGKLTADWRAVHPDVEPASQLLRRIQAEKARLIAAKKLRPEKPLPQITPAEIPFEIPKGWEWCRLGDIGDAVIGLTYKPSDVVVEGNGVPVLRANNVVNSEISYSDLVRVRLVVPNKKMANPGDILICVRSGSANLIGKCAIIRDDGMAFGAFMTLLRSEFNPYLFTFLLSATFKSQINDRKSTGINQLTQGVLNSIVVPLPPLAEQGVIVERVEALMTTCRALEAEIEQSRTHAAHLLQAVLKEAFAPAS